MFFSLSHFQMNCRNSLNEIYHLTSNLLSHCLAKIECSNLQLYQTLFNANVVQNRIFLLSVKDVKLMCKGMRSIYYNTTEM